jgi:hypothetical protein
MNMDEMRERGRGPVFPVGSYNGRFTEDEVLEMRNMADEGYEPSYIAECFGTDGNQVWRIVSGKIYPRVGGPRTFVERGTSRFRGVRSLGQNKKWQAQIYVKGKTIKLGRFTSEIDAARAWNNAVIAHSLNRPLNVIEEPTLDLASLLRFPCDTSKRPLISNWPANAGRDDYSNWPLVGVPTGAANGFDALDIDLAGSGWWDAHRAELPATQTHVTRSGGADLLFKHAEGLRCSVGRIATGVDVRADGGFVVWWPRQGLRVIEAALAEWPEWLLEKARKRELVQPEDKAPCLSTAPHGAAPGGVTLNLRNRSYALLQKVAHALPGTRNRLLNWASYQFGTMIAEGVIVRDTAEQLLRGAAQTCGLWREDGAAQCMATIKSGLVAGIRAGQGHELTHGALTSGPVGNAPINPPAEPFHRRRL